MHKIVFLTSWHLMTVVIVTSLAFVLTFCMLVVNEYPAKYAKEELKSYHEIQFCKRLITTAKSKQMQQKDNGGAVYNILTLNNISKDEVMTHNRWGGVLCEDSPRSRCPVCSPPVYMTPPGPLTAMASYPGSGNTWVRHLLQQASGE